MLCVVEHCHAEGGHYWLARFSAYRLSSLWPYERGFNKQTLKQWRGSENCSEQNFMRQGYMLSFVDGTLRSDFVEE